MAVRGTLRVRPQGDSAAVYGSLTWPPSDAGATRSPGSSTRCSVSHGTEAPSVVGEVHPQAHPVGSRCRPRLIASVGQRHGEGLGLGGHPGGGGRGHPVGGGVDVRGNNDALYRELSDQNLSPGSSTRWSVSHGTEVPPSLAGEVHPQAHPLGPRCRPRLIAGVSHRHRESLGLGDRPVVRNAHQVVTN